MSILATAVIWIVSVIAVEAITEIIVNGDIFFRFRNWIVEKSTFLTLLFTCGYCLSVWVSFGIAWVIPPLVSNVFIDLVIKAFALHRLSNLFHEMVQRFFNRIPSMRIIEYRNKNESDSTAKTEASTEES